MHQISFRLCSWIFIPKSKGIYLHFQYFMPLYTSHPKNLSFWRVPTAAICLTMWGLTPPFWGLSFEKITQIFCPPLAFATISPMPDSGHKPKRNDNNSYGVTQRHTLTALWPCTINYGLQTTCAYLRGGGGGGLPLTKATCWLTGQGKKVILPELGYQLPKQDIFVMNRISNFHIWRILSGV